MPPPGVVLMYAGRGPDRSVGREPAPRISIPYPSSLSWLPRLPSFRRRSVFSFLSSSSSCDKPTKVQKRQPSERAKREISKLTMADSASASGATAASGGGAAAAAGIPSFTAVPLDQFDAVLGTTSTGAYHRLGRWSIDQRTGSTSAALEQQKGQDPSQCPRR